MIELFQFQATVAAQISERFIGYVDDPPIGGTQKSPVKIAFFQRLDGITGSGKTAVLAEAVNQMSQALAVAPIVLWVSKGRVVVDQTLDNLSAGGKYHGLLGSADVQSLNGYLATDIEQINNTQVLVATVGTFNRREKDRGNLRIYNTNLIDLAGESTWSALVSRRTAEGLQRPLIVVYDEAHNLSDQQTELLIELQPDAFLLASATQSLPPRLGREVQALKDRGWTDEMLVSQIHDADVVAAGLVKSGIQLAGYQSPMETAIDALLDDMAEADKDAQALSLEWRPKAIYVSETNRVADNAFEMDDPKRPFGEREAAPIQIWKYLVEQKGVDPAEVVVYADLKTDRDFPLPPEFNLLSQGDNDYAKFLEGNFRHVIFNLTLQEGWDDPTCYFAYIDKSMDSTIQITQVVGRALRQPDATRYSSPRLNEAHFYVRIDKKESFKTVLNEVDSKFQSGPGSLQLTYSEPGKARPTELAPKTVKSVPETALTAPGALPVIDQLIDDLPDYLLDTVNTQGAGARQIAQREIGGDADFETKWEALTSAARVSARWVAQREIKRLRARAIGYANLSDAKFDASIGFGSKAFKIIASFAERIVDAYIAHATLSTSKSNPFVVGGVFVREDDMQKYANALHDGYSGLNPLEKDVAAILDSRDLVWARNPPNTGYGIELPSLGPTAKFYPDFLVWVDGAVVCLETKGEHLLGEAVDRKLLSIRNPHADVDKVVVRFINLGKWSQAEQVQQVSKDGYTSWSIAPNGTRQAQHFDDLEAAISNALAIPTA